MNKKKLLALLMALVMTLTLVPVTALADGPTQSTEHTVTFDLNAGMAEPTQASFYGGMAPNSSVFTQINLGTAPSTRYAYTVTVTDGATVSKPVNAAGLQVFPARRDGYIFDGWQLNGVDYDFTTPVKGDITLTAKWKQYTNSISIANAEEFLAWATMFSSSIDFNGVDITLTGDVIFTDTLKPWKPLTGFSGALDGNGHKITGLNMTQNPIENGDYTGLFYQLSSGSISNLTIESPTVSSEREFVGALAGSGNIPLNNVHVTGTISITGLNNVGGLFGAAGDGASFTNCSVDGGSAASSTIAANATSGRPVGGLIGNTTAGATLTNCSVSNVTVSGARKIGGLIGQIQTAAAPNNAPVICTGANVSNVTLASGAGATFNDHLTMGGMVGIFASPYGEDNFTGTVSNITMTGPANIAEGKNYVMGLVSGGTGDAVEAAKTAMTGAGMTFNVNVTGTNSCTIKSNTEYAGIKGLAPEPNYVARIGETYYSDLQDAIAVAMKSTEESNKTVTLLKDVTVDTWYQNVFATSHTQSGTETNYAARDDEVFGATKGPNGITIDGKNYTLTVNKILSNGNGNLLFAFAENLTVRNLTIAAPNGINIKSGIIENVKFNMTGGSAIQTSVNDDSSSIEIKGCTFDSTVADASGILSDGSDKDTKTGIIISGNTFNTYRSVVLRNDMQFLHNVVNSAKGVTINTNSTARVEGNYFTTGNTSRSINIYPAPDAVITGNIILGDIELENLVYSSPQDLSGNYWKDGVAPAGLDEAKTSYSSYYTSKEIYDSRHDDGTLFALSNLVSTSTYVAQIGETKYETLAAAIAAVPDNGTATTITMIGDEAVVAGVTIAAGQNIILELNGKTISGNTDSAATYALITNKGTLTIQDNTDTNKNGTGSGLITTYISNPDQGDIPGYASNTITNYGTLTVKSGKIVNNGSGYACYPIDNQTNGNLYTPVLTIEGGRMEQMNAYTYAVRMFCNSTTNYNTVSVSGGVITGGYGLWLQTPNKNANKASLTISGGILEARDGAALYVGGTKADNSQIKVKVSGGEILGTGAIIQGPLSGTYGEVAVSGGKIKNIQCGANVEKFITGGVFGVEPDAAYIADEYAAMGNYDEATKDTYPYIVAKPVAKIGDTQYATLADAIAAAKAGDTVTLLRDYDMEANEPGYGYTSSFLAEGESAARNNMIKIGDNVTFDLGGHTLSNLFNNTFNVTGKNVVVQNGKMCVGQLYYSNLDGTTIYTSENDKTCSYVMYVKGASNFVVNNLRTYGGINVSGSTATINNLQFSGTKFYAVCSQDGADVTINGGTYNKAITGATSNMFWIESGSTMNITGGNYVKGTTTFIDGVKPVITGGKFDFDPTNYGVADGYEAVSINESPYIRQVGKITTTPLQANDDATDTNATYDATKTVVDENGTPLTTADTTISVTVTANETETSSEATAKISNITDEALRDVVGNAADKADDANVQTANVKITVAKNALDTETAGKVTYEVHPEAIITVKDAYEHQVGEATTVKLTNDQITGSFTFTLDVPTDVAKYANSEKVIVNHKHADGTEYLGIYPVAQDQTITLTGIKSFSEFELILATDANTLTTSSEGASLRRRVWKDSKIVVNHETDLRFTFNWTLPTGATLDQAHSYFQWKIGNSTEWSTTKVTMENVYNNSRSSLVIEKLGAANFNTQIMVKLHLTYTEGNESKFVEIIPTDPRSVNDVADYLRRNPENNIEAKWVNYGKFLMGDPTVTSLTVTD